MPGRATRSRRARWGHQPEGAVVSGKQVVANVKDVIFTPVSETFNSKYDSITTMEVAARTRAFRQAC